MAVPSTGALTMLGIAQERKFSTYGSGTISNPILMTDLISGGGNNSFPALNTASASKPNTSTPHAMSEWYGYDQDAASGYSGNISERSNSDSNEACGLSVAVSIYKNGTSSTPVAGDYLFTNSGLSTNLVPNEGFGKWYKYEDVAGGNVPYAVYLLENTGGECTIESVSACD
tara:strand:- start:4 stop:519 length:516 start_codon:yes stop_codon:yes gene_type:complete